MAGRKTPAVTALVRATVTHTIHDLGEEGVPDDGRDYGTAAAEVMDTDPARVFKTILVTDGDLAVAIVPVTTTVDLKATAKALGTKKVAVADPADAERVTGYVVGGISPLGQRKRLRTVLDDTAMAHDTVFVSGGRRGLELELAPADLARVTGATVAQAGRRD